MPIDIKILKPEHSSHLQNSSSTGQSQPSQPSQPVYIASQEFVNRSIMKQNPVEVPGKEKLKELKSSIDLLHNQNINQEVQDFLRDNPHFRVIAVLGRGAKKMSLLNTLLDQNQDIFSDNSKGVQMFITRDRHILLNVNLDHFHKSHLCSREGEVELLMLYITLLKTTHTMIFAEQQVDFIQQIRLLRCAELMDFGYDKLGLNPEYAPNILILSSEDDKDSKRTPIFVESLFKGSKLQAFVRLVDDKQLFKNLIKVAYQMPSYSMSLQTTPPPFTELNWFQLLQGLWKQHKTNYFLVKYAKGGSFQ